MLQTAIKFGGNLLSVDGDTEVVAPHPATAKKFPFLEFFAGSGLVSLGLSEEFYPAWANDISPRKANIYTANHDPSIFHLGSITEIKGRDLPAAPMAWASFPCQDLSLAGLAEGIHAERSGLVWEWLRVIDEMKVKPRVLVAENVVGLISGAQGENYRVLHRALSDRGYKVGAVVLDAAHWLPQSRPRVFVIAARVTDRKLKGLIDSGPNWMHSDSLIRASEGLPNWVWWKAERPKQRNIDLTSILDWDAPVDSVEKRQKNLNLISEKQREIIRNPSVIAAPGYKRTRKGKQVLELRFDGLAGCLRTPSGGSSRQYMVLRKGDEVSTRLLTISETAKLMGVPENYLLPGSYNDAYMAMGDGVAVPVADFISKQFLSKLV